MSGPELEEYADTEWAELWVCDDDVEENFLGYMLWLDSTHVYVDQ